MSKPIIKSLIIIIIFISFTACSSIPKGVQAVTPFEKEKFLGKWYEIARLDYYFEKNLSNNTAVYSLRSDGLIKVVNRGYNYKKNEREDVEGKAKFAGDENVAMLKVSFFGPFYSGYNVIAIDEAYKYALIAGDSFKYLWILSREKTIPEDVKSNYVKIASDAGFDTSELIWVEQDKSR